MLEKLNINEFNKYVEYAYNLSQNLTTASYPIYVDGIKNKDDFINTAYRSFELELDEILLFKNNNKVKGWIHYYYDEDDDSVFTCSCLCEGLYKLMIKEFIEYIKIKYPTTKIYLGFPKDNQDACNSCVDNEFELVETNINNVLNLDNYIINDTTNNIFKLKEEDFELFRKLHDNINIDVYWNSDRILANFYLWRIYIYQENDVVLGAIYSMDEKILLEVFGIDYLNNNISKKIYQSLLTSFINDAKIDGIKHIVYFNEYQEELEFLKSIGFNSIGEYRYYLKK